MMAQDTPDFPHEFADRFTVPFSRFLKVEAATGLLLLLAATAALGLANSPWSGPFLGFWETPVGLHFGPMEFTRSLRHWINDGLMTFFFFVIALELKRELVLGELRHPRLAALPLVAAIGGMLVPVSLYLAMMTGKPGAHGWGTVMATDTAFVIGCLALFGNRIPAEPTPVLAAAGNLRRRRGDSGRCGGLRRDFEWGCACPRNTRNCHRCGLGSRRTPV